MPYSVTGNDTAAYEGAVSGGYKVWAFEITEALAGSGDEFTIRVPQVGTITFMAYELTTLGSSTTIRPTFRTATGTWDGSGAGANDDINRVSAAAAQGQEQTKVRYYAPAGTLYVRMTYSNAAQDATSKLRLVIVEGHTF